MRKVLFSLLLIVVGLIPTGCGSKFGGLYKDGERAVKDAEKTAEAQIILKNADDSISYFMGYIYGMRFRLNLQREGVDTEGDLNEYEIGVAMAMEADSAELELLKGIMAGLSLRNAYDRLGAKVEWNNGIAYKGMYHGLNDSPADKIQLPEDGAEGALNRLLYNYFRSGEAPNNQ
ncbi:MAG: hypothetical protein HDS83_07330 [Bacteroidales bacterium]|nr:hypothetical protein [Bacteroidales bacterium]